MFEKNIFFLFGNMKKVLLQMPLKLVRLNVYELEIFLLINELSLKGLKTEHDG